MKRSDREKLAHSVLDEKGREINNPTPLTIAMKGSESIDERIKRLIETTLSNRAADNEFETWEESQDFEVDDDFDYEIPLTRYEVAQPEWPEESPPTGGEQGTPSNRRDNSEEAPAQAPEEPNNAVENTATH